MTLEGTAETAPTPPAAQFAVADVSDIAEEIAETSSAPNLAAIEALRTNELASAPAIRTLGEGGPTDTKGNAFDAAVHHANDDGSPKLYNGKLRRKRAKSANTESQVGNVNPAQTPGVAPVTRQLTPEQIQKARLAGRTAADTFLVSAVMIGGDEFTPVKYKDANVGEIDERAGLRGAFADYFEAKGMQDFPPGVALTMAIMGFIAPRFTMPKTQNRVSQFKTWLFAKYNQWRGKRAARTDSRDNGKREIDTSAGTESGGTNARP